MTSPVEGFLEAAMLASKQAELAATKSLPLVDTPEHATHVSIEEYAVAFVRSRWSFEDICADVDERIEAGEISEGQAEGILRRVTEIQAS